jgi:hypothetical protein
MKKVKAGPDGWSDWQFPEMKRYRMGCCDCGLVHDLQFEVVKVTRQYRDGSFMTEPAKGRYRVRFKAKRNNRSTAQIRRHKK